jgi:hypothetical protein
MKAIKSLNNLKFSRPVVLQAPKPEIRFSDEQIDLLAFAVRRHPRPFLRERQFVINTGVDFAFRGSSCILQGYKSAGERLNIQIN